MVTLTCSGQCPERVHITESEVRQLMNHPDASPRWGEISAARHIAASMGWTTTLGDPLRDRCPFHSGRRPTNKRLTP